MANESGIERELQGLPRPMLQNPVRAEHELDKIVDGYGVREYPPCGGRTWSEFVVYSLEIEVSRTAELRWAWNRCDLMRATVAAAHRRGVAEGRRTLLALCKLQQRWIKAALALSTAYRIGRRPSEKVLDELAAMPDKVGAAERAAGFPDPADDAQPQAGGR